MSSSPASDRFSPQLARLKEMGQLVQENEEFLARRITDSSRLPISFTVFDVKALTRILNDYGVLLQRLSEGGIPHPLWRDRPIDMARREGRGNIAALLPYNGPAMCFGLAYGPQVAGQCPGLVVQLPEGPVR